MPRCSSNSRSRTRIAIARPELRMPTRYIAEGISLALDSIYRQQYIVGDRTSQPVTPQRVPDRLGATPKGRKHKVVFSGPSDNPEGTMYAPIYFPPPRAPARVREQARAPHDTLTVTTWLTTRERQRVEAANCG